MTEIICRCGRQGLDPMFHSESCPVYGGSRPAVYDGWGPPLTVDQSCPDVTPHEAHGWLWTMTMRRWCPGVGQPQMCAQCHKVWGHSEYTTGQCSGCGGVVTAALA